MKEKANLEYINTLAGEDMEFREKFIGILKDEFPAEKKEYEENIQKQAFPKASENVHKMKHKLNVLGLHEGHSLAARHEMELRDETCNLNSEFTAILNYVAAYLKEI